MNDIKLEISDHDDIMNIVVKTPNYKKVITITKMDIRIYNNEAKEAADKARVDDEFHRIVDALKHQGSLDVIEDIIPTKIKKEFIKDYGEEDET